MTETEIAPEYSLKEQVHYEIGEGRVIDANAIVIGYYYDEKRGMYKYLLRVFREGDKLLMRPFFREKYEDQLRKLN